jgi:hypothetical protein
MTLFAVSYCKNTFLLGHMNAVRWCISGPKSVRNWAVRAAEEQQRTAAVLQINPIDQEKNSKIAVPLWICSGCLERESNIVTA